MSTSVLVKCFTHMHWCKLLQYTSLMAARKTFASMLCSLSVPKVLSVLQLCITWCHLYHHVFQGRYSSETRSITVNEKRVTAGLVCFQFLKQVLLSNVNGRLSSTEQIQCIIWKVFLLLPISGNKVHILNLPKSAEVSCTKQLTSNKLQISLLWCVFFFFESIPWIKGIRLQ